MAGPQDRGWWLFGVGSDGQVVESRPGPAEVWVGSWVQPRSAELTDGRVVKVDASPRVDIQNDVLVFVAKVGTRWVFVARNDWG